MYPFMAKGGYEILEVVIIGALTSICVGLIASIITGVVVAKHHGDGFLSGFGIALGMAMIHGAIFALCFGACCVGAQAWSRL